MLNMEFSGSLRYNVVQKPQMVLLSEKVRMASVREKACMLLPQSV